MRIFQLLLSQKKGLHVFLNTHTRYTILICNISKGLAGSQYKQENGNATTIYLFLKCNLNSQLTILCKRWRMDSKTWPLTCNVWGWKIRSSKTRPSQAVAWWSGRTPGDSRTGTAPHRGQTPAEKIPQCLKGNRKPTDIYIFDIKLKNFLSQFS